MPKLNTFKVKIETGSTGIGEPVRFAINSHTLPFENTKGGTGAGEVFEGEYDINSFAHSLTLVGPDEGEWHIDKITVDLLCESTEPYSINYGAVVLTPTNQVNIWQDPPIPAFNV